MLLLMLLMLLLALPLQVGPVTSSVLNTLKRVIIIVVTSVVLGEVGEPSPREGVV